MTAACCVRRPCSLRERGNEKSAAQKAKTKFAHELPMLRAPRESLVLSRRGVATAAAWPVKAERRALPRHLRGHRHERRAADTLDQASQQGREDVKISRELRF